MASITARRSLLAFAAIAWSAPAMPGELPPEGWARHEHDTSGINEIALTYRAPGGDHFDIAFACSRNFAEVNFTYAVRWPDEPDGKQWSVRLSGDGTAYPIDAVGRQQDGLYLIEAYVEFEPPLAELLLSGFTVHVGEEETGRYAAEDGGEDIAATIDACQDR